MANGLVSLSSAAVLAIYAAGYSRTRSAAEELDAASAQRRPVVPAPAPDTYINNDPPARDHRSAPGSAAPAAVAVASAPVKVEAAPAQPAPSPSSVPLVAAPQKAAASSGAGKVASVKVAGTAASTNGAPPKTEAEATAPGSGPAVAGDTATAAAPAEAAAPPVRRKDGTYRAWGRSRHGDILSFVVIENGRIVHSGIDRCETRWPCSLVSHLAAQVLQRQSAEVDYVSGATQSGNAFYYGILEALEMSTK